jgi:tetratricopeptide (TPR) repeat protein
MCAAASLASLWFSSVCSNPAFAQERRRLENLDYVLEVAQKVDSLLVTNYVLPEEAERYAAEFRRRYTSGAYNSFTDPAEYAEKVTADLIDISGDSHFSFRVIRVNEPGEDPKSHLRHPVRYSRLGQRENLGFFKLEWIDGRVGLLDLRRFYPISVSKEMVDAAMLFLSNAKAIVIDVRENGGGAGESLEYFCSYFLDYPTQLTSDYSRKNDFLTEYWTTAEVSGARRTDVPVFIVTGGRTFSAAETFAYDMQANGRATLVGDSTGGGAHSVDLFQVDDLFEIYIPTSRAINPVTSENWEGTGVIPDVIVPSEAALDSALVLAMAAADEYGAIQERRVNSAVEKMQRLLSDAESLYRAGRNEDTDPVLDSLFQMGAEAGIINEFFVFVLTYEYLGDSDEAILFALFEKWIELYPQSVTPWEWMASKYASKGDKQRAIECYEAVLRIDPDNANAERRIARLRTE